MINFNNKNDLDYFVFLLSADWANEFVKSSLNVSNQNYIIVRDAARNCVREIMSTTPRGVVDYYCADFSDLRISKTQKSFNDFLAKKKLGYSELVKLDNFVNDNSPSSREEEVVLNTFWLILIDAASDETNFSGLDISKDELNFLMESITNCSSDDFPDFEELEAESGSEWDKYLISLRPDSPTAISDFMSIRFDNIESFAKFWAIAMLNKEREYKKHLISWLISEYEFITESKCYLPDWLIELNT